MGKFLTGKARLQQTDRKRIWKLLDNELFKADDGKIYLTPRTMYTDNYTIPLVLSWLAGSPVDFDTRGSHLHDECCYWHLALYTTLTEEELIEKGYLKYSVEDGLWICGDIPAKYLASEKISKCRANNLLYECMEAAGVPFGSRAIVRAGVAFNINWFLYLLNGKVFDLEIDRIYDENYWREHVGI